MGLKANSQDDIPNWLIIGFLLFQGLQIVAMLVLVWIARTSG